MPEYKYICLKCQNKFSATMPMQNYLIDDRQNCPRCKSGKTNRFYENAPDVVYRGDGWTGAAKTKRRNNNDDEQENGIRRESHTGRSPK